MRAISTLLPVRSSPLAQGAVLFLGAVALVLLVPVILVALVLAAVALGVMGARAWLARQRGPNGRLDGRRNVRVRLPEEPPAA